MPARQRSVGRSSEEKEGRGEREGRVGGRRESKGVSLVGCVTGAGEEDERGGRADPALREVRVDG